MDQFSNRSLINIDSADFGKYIFAPTESLSIAPFQTQHFRNILLKAKSQIMVVPWIESNQKTCQATLDIVNKELQLNGL